jgi:glycosyltransferase involved in cell wall biosynthesis
MSRSRSRLRVVRVYLHLDVGGIETRLVDLLPRFDRDRFEVQLVCIRRRGALAPVLEAQGIPVGHCHYRTRLPFGVSVRALARYLKRLRPDIVQTHGTLSMLVGTAAAHRAAVPIILGNCHNVGVFSRPWEVRKERRLSAFRDATIHVSESVRDDYLESVRPENPESAIIYNGVDVDAFSAPPGKEALQALAGSLGIDGKSPVLINVSRLHRNKAHEDLLQAFARVLARHEDAVLLLAGDGDRRGNIEVLARELGIGTSVRVLGSREDVKDLYHLAHLGVLSSIKEGFSNVVLEAMAAGLPQVLTDVGGNREAIGESSCGLLVPARDPEALAGAILEVVDDPPTAQAMRTAAAERVKKFAVEEQVRRTESLYLELARRKGLLDDPAAGRPGAAG